MRKRNRKEKKTRTTSVLVEVEKFRVEIFQGLLKSLEKKIWR